MAPSVVSWSVSFITFTHKQKYKRDNVWFKVELHAVTICQLLRVVIEKVAAQNGGQIN